jgi:hypothetical protein
MPMFFFHIVHADGATSTDDIGSEFATIELAREEASRALHEMAMDVRSGSGVTMIQIEVTDEAGRPVARRRAVFEAEDLET